MAPDPREEKEIRCDSVITVCCACTNVSEEIPTKEEIYANRLKHIKQLLRGSGWIITREYSISRIEIHLSGDWSTRRNYNLLNDKHYNGLVKDFTEKRKKLNEIRRKATERTRPMLRSWRFNQFRHNYRSDIWIKYGL